MKEQKYDAIIIGAGLAGLSVASYLSKQGLSVALFEKLPQLGGFVHCFKRGEYTFEASTHQLCGLSHSLYGSAVFRILGINTKHIKTDTLCEIINFTSQEKSLLDRYVLPTGIEAIRKALCEYFPHTSKDIDTLFRYMRKVSKDSLDLKSVSREPKKNIVNAIFALMLRDGKGLLKSIGKLRFNSLVRYANTTYEDAISFIKDDNLKWLLNAYTSYAGSSPDKLNAVVFGTILYLYMCDSPYVFKGGTQSLVDDLKDSILKNGGIIHTKTPVKRICTKQGQATGIETEDGHSYQAKTVISAINTNDTFLHMLDTKEMPEEFVSKVKTTESTLSAFQIYLGLSINPIDYGFTAPTTFFNSTKNAVKKFEQWTNSITAKSREETSFIFSNYSDGYNEFAPKGHSSTVIAELMPMDDWDKITPQEYKKKKQQYQETILHKVETLTGIPISSKANVIESATPRTMKHYSSAPDGAFLGAAITNNQALQKRMQPETPIKNLFLAGAYTSYGGVINGLDSGIITSNLVLKTLK